MSEKSYKAIAKNTAILGGTEVFNILVGVLRGKFVAMFLGAEGMGISSLLGTAVNTIQQFTNMGLTMSVVREVSAANERGDAESLQRGEQTICVARMLLRATALIGALVCIVFSRAISRLTFGNTDYRWHFVALSLFVMLTTLGNGERSILTGMHAIKRLAYASLVGSLTGLFVGVPLYYLYGQGGIVPAMIALSLATFLFYRYHTYKVVRTRRVTVSRETFTATAKVMISLGAVLMVSQLLGTLTNYSINNFIRTFGSVTDVGLFSAANGICYQYVGLVFTAMSVDYFPRLAAVQNDVTKLRATVNEQSEIVMLAVVPLLALLITLCPLVIKILLTDEFQSVQTLMRILCLSVFLRAVAYPLGYISFSKGDKRTFFWLEGVWGNVSNLLISCLCFYFWGVLGLGIAPLINYTIFITLYVILTRRLYDFRHNRQTIKLTTTLFALLLVVFASSFLGGIVSYTAMGLSCAVLCVYSLRELDKRIGIVGLLKNKFQNRQS
jgi:O-antigen/teichoic acid export membrane protein